MAGSELNDRSPRRRRKAPKPKLILEADETNLDADPPEAEKWRVVPYLPIRCPECGDSSRGKVYHGGRYGRKRYHKCGNCQTKFVSIQIDEPPGGMKPNE
ncbi:MAG: hypothetical protein ACPGQD_03395 [Planctomycetota bacterium]